MNCEKYTTRLAELHDGTLGADEAESLRSHLAACPACREDWTKLSLVLDTIAECPEEEPSPALRAGFLRQLNEEKRRLRREAAETSAPGLFSRLLSWHSLAFACGGAAALTLGLFLGARLLERHGGPAVSDNELQLARLQAKIDTLEQLLARSLHNRDNDTTRLLQTASLDKTQGVDAPARINSLLGTLAFDPSTNVRLCALESLYAHAADPLARRGVMASLPRERSPLVQLAMVDFLASLNSREVVPALQEILREPGIDSNVKAAATKVLATLPAETGATAPGRQL